MNTKTNTKGYLGWLLIWVSLSLLSVLGFFGSATDFHLESLQHTFWQHPLGVDTFGRDLFHLTLNSAAWSMALGTAAATLACVIGILSGSLITFLPRKIRFLVLRLLDFFLAFPSLLVTLALASLLGPGWLTLAAALLIETVPGFTRLSYLRAKELGTEEYVIAAQSLGATPFQITRQHLIPALFSLCRVKWPILFAHALMAEASLSFLGLGAPVGHDTWGSLLAQAKEYLIEAPRIAMTAGIPLILTVFALQRLSENLKLYSFQHGSRSRRTKPAR